MIYIYICIYIYIDICVCVSYSIPILLSLSNPKGKSPSASRLLYPSIAAKAETTHARALMRRQPQRGLSPANAAGRHRAGMVWMV